MNLYLNVYRVMSFSKDVICEEQTRSKAFIWGKHLTRIYLNFLVWLIIYFCQFLITRMYTNHINQTLRNEITNFGAS